MAATYRPDNPTRPRLWRRQRAALTAADALADCQACRRLPALVGLARGAAGLAFADDGYAYGRQGRREGGR